MVNNSCGVTFELDCRVFAEKLIPSKFGRAGRILASGFCAVALLATPAFADNSHRTGAKVVQSVSSVSASGRSRSDVRALPQRERASVQSQVSGFLQATSDATKQTTSTPNRSQRERNEASRERSTQNARIEVIRSASAAVNAALTRTHLLHQQYTILENLTAAEIAASFPKDTYLTHLQEAATRYNRSVDDYYRAVARLDTAKSQLTGGQELHGNVLEELNALLGQ